MNFRTESQFRQEIADLRAEIANLKAAGLGGAGGQSRLLLGDHFTHDRSGTIFVCRAVTMHDYGGAASSLRAEVERAA